MPDEVRYIYVAGPITSSGGYIENIRLGVLAGEQLIRLGAVPFVPHQCVTWQLVSPRLEYEFWLEYDLAWIDRCDAVFRLPGDSYGADVEVEHALKTGKPVFYSIREVADWIENN